MKDGVYSLASLFEVISNAIHRSPCSFETSDNNASFLCEPGEEDDEGIYRKLVGIISNAVIESSCVDDPEESGVPLELHIHHFLERLCNYKGANIQSHTTEFPTHDLPLRTCKPGVNVGNSRPVSMGSGHKGNGGNKKRKNGEDSNSSHGASDQDSPYDDGDDDAGHNPDRAKKHKTGEGWSCPFRKRNPVRFNVRDRNSCALVSYQSIPLLK